MPDRERDETVTEPSGRDQRLADAFRALRDTPADDVPEELRDRIWLAVSGALPPEERRDLVDRMAVDPACAEAWRVASEMWRASQTSAANGAVPAGSAEVIRATRWTPSWLAAAAALVLATTIGVVSILNRPPGDEFRTSRGTVVESLVPAVEPLPRDGFRLRWTPGPAGSRYDVRVTTEDLRVLATVADLTAPEFVLAPAALEGVPDGARVLWQVDVSLPNGERITSPTFITLVQ